MSFVTKENTQDIYPLSPTQKGILFHSLYDDATPVYHEQIAFTMTGPLDMAALHASWDHQVAMNPVLRTVFKWTRVKEPLQIVLKKRPMHFEDHDLGHLEREAQAAAFQEFLARDKSNLFELEEGPLIRLNVFSLGNDCWRILWSYHHIILDGWCLSIILNDLFTTYMAVKAGQPLPRPARRPYRDYISWYLKQDKAAALSFWRERLGDFTTPTRLPSDKIPEGNFVSEIGEEELLLTGDMTETLATFVKKEHVTQSVLIQSAWAVLLSYYSQQDDVVFGITVSGRPAGLKGADEMVGLFINTLPVRVKLNAGMSGSELLNHIQELTLSLREFEYSFLPDIRSCTSVQASQSLFDSNVVFENYPIESMAMGEGSDFGISDIMALEMTNFPLTVVIAPGSRMSIRIQYDKGRFSPETIQQMRDCLYEVLQGIAASPQDRIIDLGIISPEEKKQLLVDFNATQTPYPDTRCIHELIEETIDAFPDRICLKFGDQEMTYGALEEKSNQLANYLRSEKGVAPDVPVGVLMDRSMEMVVGVLGIIKAGGAYVPIESEYPHARIEYMLADCGAGLILTESALADKAAGSGCEVLLLDQGWDAFDGVPKTRPACRNRSDDLVYIIYTSGSTGQPKGIEIEHRGLVNYICWAVDYYDARGRGSFPLYTSMSFDLTVTSLFVPLLSGECIHIQEVGLDPTELVERVVGSDGCDIAKLTPAHLEIADSLTGDSLLKPGRLNRMILGGEALSARVSRSMLDRYPELVLYNEYGPAETVVGCIVYKFDQLDPHCTNILIGKPIANTRIYILDNHLRLLPRGIAGEIYISSPGVARGYLNKEAVTRKSFVMNPFEPGERMYRSGDLGRWLPDGNIEYLGRIDHQVKIRGYRIELGEIEAVLALFQGVHACVVIDRLDPSGAKSLVGYYVADDDIPIQDLRQHLAAALPEYMVPSRFMRMDALPLTPNGKVDRDALPDVEGRETITGQAYAAPTNDLEEILASAWQDILNLDKVGIHDNFFDLGGDSIISLQVAGRLKKEGYAVRPRDIFEQQTIAELAPVVAKTAALKIDQGPVTGSAPFTPIQHWFFNLHLANPDHFNQSLIFKSEMRLDEGVMEQSLAMLAHHHDALRMRFNDGTFECNPPEAAPFFVAKDVSDKSALEKEVNSLQHSFSLKAGSVFSAGLYRMAGADYLALAGHHMVLDGVSWRILLEDLLLIYTSLSNGGKVALPSKTTSYKDWSIKLHEYARSLDFKEELGFWRHANSAGPAALPVDHDTGPNTMDSVDVIRIELSEADTDHLVRDANQSYNTETNDLLLTALMRALSRWTRNPSVLFDLEGHGREDVLDGVDISRTVGWFTTIFPVVLTLEAGKEMEAQIKYVKETLRSIPQKGFHYGMLKHMTDVRLENPAQPEVCFNYLGQMDASALESVFELADDITPMTSDRANLRPYLVDINCSVKDSKLLVYLGYSKNRFVRSSIASLAERLKSEIEEVIGYCMDRDHAGYTPSDFKLTDISQDQLDDLIDDI